MITRGDLFKIGKLHKSHGIRGELILMFDEADFGEIETDFYFFEIESTFVPFFVEEIIFSDHTRARVKFEDIDDEIKASRFSNTEIYIHRKEISMPDPEEWAGWNYFIGYSIIDQNNKNLGVIKRIDTSTINNLFILQQENVTLLIPATEDFIVKTDDQHHLIYMNLPEGLTD